MHSEIDVDDSAVGHEDVTLFASEYGAISVFKGGKHYTFGNLDVPSLVCAIEIVRSGILLVLSVDGTLSFFSIHTLQSLHEPITELLPNATAIR